MTTGILAAPLRFDDVALTGTDGAAVAGLTLDVPGGAVVALVGPGADDAVRAAVGLRPVAAGRVLAAGRPLAAHDRPARVVGVVPAHAALAPGRTVAAHLRIAARLAGAGAGADAVAAAAGRAGLDPRLLGRRPPRLGPVDRRRAALARALVGRPAAVVLEAPLDRLRETAELRALAGTLRALAADGLAVLLSCRDPRVGAAVADRAVAPAGREEDA